MKKEDIQIGKRYWYRFCHDFQVRSGVCVGVTEENVLFQQINKKARVVDLQQVHCEDVTTKSETQKPWWRLL